MKYALYTLDSHHHLSAAQVTAVFKRIFEREVSEWVVTDERLQFLIKTHLYEGKTQRSRQWRDIYSTATKPEDIASRRVVEAMIQQTMSSMDKMPAVPAAATTTTATTTTTTTGTTGIAHSSRHPNSRSPYNTSAAPKTPVPAPLSKQAPIGSWDPALTDDDDDIIAVAPSPKRRRITSTIQHHPSADLSRQSRSVRTPQKRVKRPSVPKVGFLQAHGTLIQWPRDKIEKAKHDLPEVPEVEAHPPQNGLLFRYYREDTIGSELRNSRNGFVARKFEFAKVDFNQPPPLCNQLDWVDVFYHIDRSGKKIDWPSVFVSTSNSLLWTLQKALKELNKNPGSIRISVIDAYVLDRKSVYHVLPYHRRLQLKGEFTDGSWRYPGTHEFLVYKRIPGKAVIHTFDLNELLHFVQYNQDAYDPVIERILRRERLDQSGDLKSDIYKKLVDDAIPLCPTIVSGIAKLTAFAGIKSYAPISQISAFVAEIVKGWGLKLHHRSASKWSELATTYSTALFQYSAQPRVNLREEICIKRAFLEGVFWGSSKHFNPRHCPEHVQSTYRSAKKIGLEDPGKMLMDEVSAMQMALMWYEKTLQRRLPGGHRSQLLLLEEEEEEQKGSSVVSDEGFAEDEDENHENVNVNENENEDDDDDGDGDGDSDDGETFVADKFFIGRRDAGAGAGAGHVPTTTTKAPPTRAGGHDDDDRIIYMYGSD